MKVLVAESNPMLCSVIANMLIQKGFMVETCAGGKEAVQNFHAQAPAAVILALDLSDVNGYHVLTKMRQLNENVPVIVISPDETIASAVKLVKAGAYDYIPKSNMAHLVSVVRDAIQIGESPEVVHDQLHTEGEAKGAMIHREHDRINFKQEIKVDDKYIGKSINLSVGGMYIYTGRPHKIGSKCMLKFYLFDQVVSIEGMIRQSEFSVGMGVEFINLHPHIRTALETLISRSASEQKEGDTAKIWILMISDDNSALRMYKSQFMLKGFSILETRSLDKAAEYLRTKEVSTIIMDIDMQGVDAVKTIYSIKSVEALAKIPIIAFTSSYKSEAADPLKAAGAAYFASRMTTPPKKLSEILEKLNAVNPRHR